MNRHLAAGILLAFVCAIIWLWASQHRPQQLPLVQASCPVPKLVNPCANGVPCAQQQKLREAARIA
jgi:hypothetical protein